MWLSQIVSLNVSLKATSLLYYGGLELNVSVLRYTIVYVLKPRAHDDIIFILQ